MTFHPEARRKLPLLSKSLNMKRGESLPPLALAELTKV
jgi:hypothetical protein